MVFPISEKWSKNGTKKEILKGIKEVFDASTDFVDAIQALKIKYYM